MRQGLVGLRAVAALGPVSGTSGSVARAAAGRKCSRGPPSAYAVAFTTTTRRARCHTCQEVLTMKARDLAAALFLLLVALTAGSGTPAAFADATCPQTKAVFYTTDTTNLAN